MKEHIYSTDEYEVKIGDPVVDAEVKASSTSVAIPCEAIADGEYLVSLEVNGTVVSHRELLAFASGSCTVGDYTLAYSSYAVTVSTTSNNDVVRLKVEPVDVYVTDAMKAAVAKVAPKSEGGSGGGTVVHAVYNENTLTLDKTWQEIKDADAVSVVFDDAEENARNFFFCTAVFERVPLGGDDTQYVVHVSDLGNAQILEFIADSASGYPSETME